MTTFALIGCGKSRWACVEQFRQFPQLSHISEYDSGDGNIAAPEVLAGVGNLLTRLISRQSPKDVDR